MRLRSRLGRLGPLSQIALDDVADDSYLRDTLDLTPNEVRVVQYEDSVARLFGCRDQGGAGLRGGVGAEQAEPQPEHDGTSTRRGRRAGWFNDVGLAAGMVQSGPVEIPVTGCPNPIEDAGQDDSNPPARWLIKSIAYSVRLRILT